MNGEAECPADLEMTAPKNQDRWSQEDMLTLLECMKNNLPSNDGSKFKTTESHLDWEKVAFKDFSGEMCKMKWMEISNEVRKFRTLTELIMDAEEHVKNPYKGKKLKKHPDFPKKPLTPYFRFFMEKRAKYAKLHPEMSNLDLTKILSKKYKELPEKKKMKYIQDFQREKQEFERNLARFREDHPDLIQNAKKSDVPEKPKTPQQLWYNHEKKIYLKVRPDEIMRDYIQKHPELNISEEGITRSTLTKAERQLKDKFDGRPTKPPPNSYSLYCAELMANMKDVPSTERMVLCSQQWKLLSQKEKDAYHKKCDQKKKDYEIELLRFLESLPEEEQQRVLGEEKMLGSNRKGATSPASKKSSPETGKASSEKPKRPISAMFIFSEEKRKQLQEERPELSESELTRLLARMWNDLSEKKKAKYKAREAAMKAQSEKKHGSDKEERGKLPESPKTAEEIWQQSVIGDYLARFKNDRGKALKAMEATWNNMEKKEKLMWIKKAAEDQKRYERELSEMRAPPCSTNSAKKMKFQGEPKKPPMNGYQKFSQELLSNGELNHLPLKERMVEIGSRWQRISQGQKDHYKKLAEEQQKQYKVHLDIWLKSLSPQERAAYKEHTSNKRKSIGKIRGPNPKMKPTMQSKSESEDDDEEEEEEEDDDEDEDDDDDNGDSSEEGGDSSESSSEEESEDGDENDEDDEDEDDEDEDDNDSEGSSSSSSSSGDSSDSDSN
ncbi:nucleolar transcription factor 1 isoform X10 [Grus americana]|uniref:nucleolar transcription factor 1 isoform X8 n=1 Tax=Haliaeetus leucocephalus TaxID=52644 RepID=UPI00053CB6D5|nr:PREDICTED: nucleolar transcription factor 1 isoform X8 [Haliaeetus leucocephalus]XP_029877363.1 nucleolar transcription factor 1 isoform X8 [Aquila chrysaetos chrysaetos]XP_042643351.1 nucleolar transcription factor 1 isoform X7 [Tyto alba]XP_049656829.1 nucleolar transcription factor 1 isoform X8 [Accipiter gentilis]XP_052641169.1 nucleolar transcription factor 1 isoform X8 [Harpia harpyja]XP_054657223.1 nucleolar transcription factor 1 isoform X10 [Grus americana]